MIRRKSSPPIKTYRESNHVGPTAKAPTNLKLNFSEGLVSRFSGATLVMTGMPGMAMPKPMAIAAKASLGNGGKTLVVALAKPLTRGLAFGGKAAYECGFGLVVAL